MSNLEKNFNLSPAKQFPLSQEEEEILGKVLEAVRQIKFGYIQITIQDGRVVQIDRTEKQRFTGR
jgi:hypothetical protein